MTEVIVVGGVYREFCSWPEWKMVFGSGGRAAAAMCGLVDQVTLLSYASPEIVREFEPYAATYGFGLDPSQTTGEISFEYVHPMSIPSIRPRFGTIRGNGSIAAKGGLVLRFGMLEGTAVIDADTCVYDPQNAFVPEQFGANGSKARRLAIVANAGEIATLSGSRDKAAGARILLDRSKAEVVVVKSGIEGALVVTTDRATSIPAYKAGASFTIGSGDVFAAAFAAFWGAHGRSPEDSARLASMAVADYVEDRNLPIRSLEALESAVRRPLIASRDKVYLAGPFFTMAQLWQIDEAKRCLADLGMSVFSPFHEIGPGPADMVGPADIEALKKCDAVFAVLDGLDSGTIFEVGYARAVGKPVVGFAQNVVEEDLKMIDGSGCQVFRDFVTALVAVAARS